MVKITWKEFLCGIKWVILVPQFHVAFEFLLEYAKNTLSTTTAPLSSTTPFRNEFFETVNLSSFFVHLSQLHSS